MNFPAYFRKFAFLAVSLSAFFAVACVSIAEAQSVASVSIKLSPEFPKPYQDITAELISYSANLDESPIIWSLDGKNTLSGTGKKTFSFKAGGPGSVSRLAVVAQTDAGNLVDAAIISPASVDFLWQADGSYVPPFYKGRTLPAPGASIRVVAMPEIYLNGSAQKPGALVYKWSRNDNSAQNLSGYGKNYASFQNSYLNDSEKISVTASSAGGERSTEGEVSIGVTNPFVLFYEKSPLRGVRYEKALSGDFSLSGQEAEISAEPYFFSTNGKQADTMQYSWSLNDKTVTGNPDDPSSIVLRNDSGGSGSSKVSVSVSRPGRLLQNAAGSLIVNFGGQN